jgi:hypothetical protein
LWLSTIGDPTTEPKPILAWAQGAPASNKLSFMHLNIRSIVNKFDSFKQLINSFNTPFQVICLTETWLNDNNDDLFELENYDFVK